MKAMGRGASRAANAITRTITNIPKTKLLILMKSINIINGLALCFACYFAFVILSGITSFFLATYIGIAGILLLAFELKVGKKLKKFVRSQCGFMYTYYGRLGFLVL